jgi:parallel beta-helix repeat protein
VTLRELELRFPQAFASVDGALLVRLPILVSPGASLLISGLDAKRVHLSADAGVFIVNAGKLFIVDAELAGWSEAAGKVAWHEKEDSGNFRPFVISWSHSETFVGGSKLVALGYQSPKSFGLSFSAGPSNVMKRHSEKGEPTGMVVDSLFENFEYGVYTYEAQQVAMVGNEYKDSLIYGMDPHDRSHGLTIAYNTAYGTHEKHGIIVSREVDRSFIVGNVVFRNRGSGFMLDRDSTANIIYANTAFDNDQDGITLFESSCNLIMANHFIANKRSGIKLRNSWDIGIHLNAIVRNERSGIDGYIADLRSSAAHQSRDYELDPYVPVTTFVASGNDLAGNGSGVTLSGVSGATLSENTIRLKPKRLYGGDVSNIMLKMLQMSSRAVVRSTCRPKRPAYACPLRDLGLMGDDASAELFDPAGPDDCTEVDGSVQSSAFRRFREAS